MRIIELSWQCRECEEGSIPGRHKRCPSCGSPREESEMKMPIPKQGATVTDPELLGLAEAGADWFCPNCDAGNIGNGNRCKSCGKVREDVAKTVPKAPPRVHWQNYQVPPEVSAPPRESIQPQKVEADPYLKQGLIFGASMLIGTCILAVTVWAFQTHTILGSVSKMTWERDVHVERWTDTTVRKWKHDTWERLETSPVDGFGEVAGMEILPHACREEHFTDERYVSGRHKVCTDVFRTERESYPCTKNQSYVCEETCSPNGNGFATCHDKWCNKQVSATCTRDKKVFDHESCHMEDEWSTRPIYKEKCDYLTQKWAAAGTSHTSGEGKDFSWGDEPQGDEVRLTYSANYRVHFADEHGRVLDLTFSANRSSKNTAENEARSYLEWTIGESVELEVYNFGGVREAHHLTLEQ